MFNNLKLIFLVLLFLGSASATESPFHTPKKKYWVDDDDQKSAIKTSGTSNWKNKIEQEVSLQHASAEKNEAGIKIVFQSFGKNKNELIEFIKKEKLSKETALHRAIIQGHEKIVEMLLTLFKIDSTNYLMKEDANKNTCFHLSAKHGNVNILNLLLNAFSDEKEKIMEQIMKKNVFLNTALHIALEKGSEKIAQIFILFFKGKSKLLMEYITQKNKFGVTSLALVGEHEHEEVFNVILNIFENVTEEDTSSNHQLLEKKENENVSPNQKIEMEDENVSPNQKIEKEDENVSPNQKIEMEDENNLFLENCNPQIDFEQINIFQPASSIMNTDEVPTNTIVTKNQVDFFEHEEVILNIFENFANKDFGLTTSNQLLKKEDENYLFHEKSNPIPENNQIDIFQPSNAISIFVPIHKIIPQKNKADFIEILIINLALFLFCILVQKKSMTFC